MGWRRGRGWQRGLWGGSSSDGKVEGGSHQGRWRALLCTTRSLTKQETQKEHRQKDNATWRLEVGGLLCRASVLLVSVSDGCQERVVDFAGFSFAESVGRWKGGAGPMGELACGHWERGCS